MPDLIYMNVTEVEKSLLRKFFLGYSTDNGYCMFDAQYPHSVKETDLVAGNFVEFREKPTDDERQQLSTILCKSGYAISDSNSADSDNSWPLQFGTGIRYAIKKQGNQLPVAP